MVGGAGNDTYRFANASIAQTDCISEGSGGGNDTLEFSGVTTSVTANLSSDTLATLANRTVLTFAAGQFINFENFYGGSGDDTITGNTAANRLFGNAGNDTFFAKDSNKLVDTIDGGLGTDVLSSSDPSDVVLNFP
jgi:Ca2+-binding RTX toxin-like protein